MEDGRSGVYLAVNTTKVAWILKVQMPDTRYIYFQRGSGSVYTGMNKFATIEITFAKEHFYKTFEVANVNSIKQTCARPTRCLGWSSRLRRRSSCPGHQSPLGKKNMILVLLPVLWRLFFCRSRNRKGQVYDGSGLGVVGGKGRDV